MVVASRLNMAVADVVNGRMLKVCTKGLGWSRVSFLLPVLCMIDPLRKPRLIWR